MVSWRRYRSLQRALLNLVEVNYRMKGLNLRLTGEQISSMKPKSKQWHRDIVDELSLWKPYDR